MLGLLAAWALAAAGCTDPEGRYRDFLDRTEDLRARDAGAVDPGERFDWSGRYLLALATTLAPAEPLLFDVEAEVSADLQRIDLRFRPLTAGEDDEPRTPVGEEIEVTGVAYENDGSFALELGEITVPGEANPISGSEIVAEVRLDATTLEPSAERPSAFCGSASGLVSVPLELDLEGSTFGALAVDEDFEAPLLTRCP